VNTSYPSAFDRRSRPRFQIRAPLTILAQGHEISAFTRDISNRGVYFYISTTDAPSVGEVLEFVIELPAEVTLSESCRIRCQGKVLRTSETSWDEAGVATELFRYAFLSDDRSGTSSDRF
jgi:hypothetical protein